MPCSLSGARDAVRSRVTPRIRIRRWRRAPSQEEVVQEVNRVADAQLAGVIEVGRVRTRRSGAPKKQVPEDGYGIREVDRRVGVHTPAHEDPTGEPSPEDHRDSLALAQCVLTHLVIVNGDV